MNEPETIRTILEKTKTIAVVGLSDKPNRPSFYVSRYMQQARISDHADKSRGHQGTGGKGISDTR